MSPTVFFGALVGVAVPAVFSAILIFGVNKNSQKLVTEIHRQFDEVEGLKEGKVQPDYTTCINIATTGAIKELIPAGLMAILITLAVGFIGRSTSNRWFSSRKHFIRITSCNVNE